MSEEFHVSEFRNYPELGGTGSSEGDQFIWVFEHKQKDEICEASDPQPYFSTDN